MRKYLAALLFACLLTTSANAHPPYALVIDRDGNAYFSDLETVWRYSRDGRLSIFRLGIPDRHVHELALAPSGAIEGDQNTYDPATERYYTGLWRRTPPGTERAVVPMTEHPPPGAGVLQDQDGSRYVTQRISNHDPRMQLLRRRRDGHVDVLFDETGGLLPIAVTVAAVGGMTFGSDGSLYFASDRVLRRRGRDGAITLVYRGGADSSLRGLAATAKSVLAADMGAKSVVAVGRNVTNTVYREKAAWLPTAVAAANGRLLVLEANADPHEYDKRVRLIEVRNGSPRLLASPSDRGAAASSDAALAVDRHPRVPPVLLAGLAMTAITLLGWMLHVRAR